MNSMMDFYLASGDILFRVWHLIHFINKKYLYLTSPIIIVLIWSIFIFLYGLPGGNAWSVDSKKIDEIRTNFYTMIKAYPKLKDYMTQEMYKYHPLMFANKVFPPRLEVCVNRSGKVFAQMQEAQSFNEDPLNKAKGLKYQFQYEGTLNRRLAYKLYDTLIKKDEDVSQYVYEYSLKGAKK